MPRNDAKNAELGVAKLARQLTAEPRLHAELQRARREFFGVEVRGGPVVPGAADAAAHRFAEWFALERDSETLGAVPVTVQAFAAFAAELADSVAGVYLVQSVAANVAQARDLQDDALIDLVVPAGSLLAGDLVVGRLFAVAAGQWTPSTAAAVFRPGADLAQAFRRDVQRLDLERRLYQIELEHLLLRRPDQGRSPTSAPPEVPLEHLEADLERMLQTAGGDWSASAISQHLAAAARPGQVIGPLLEQLAFDTDVDLDRARALLLEIWNARCPAGDGDSADAELPAPSTPGETLGERLARTLDEGLRQHRDVGELFAQLERMAGIEPEAEEGEQVDEELDSDVEHVSGDLGPLVEEYLWETERANDPAAAPLRVLVELQQNAPLPRTDLERVTAADLMRLLLHVYLGAAPAARASDVRTAFAELRSFYRWATSTQELPVGEALEHCHGALLDHLDRLQAAGQALSTATGSTATGSTGIGSTPAAAGLRPGMLEIEEVGPRGFGARDDDGGHHWIESPRATSHLRAGDLVLGALAPAGSAGKVARAFTGLVVVLPADARALME